MLFSDRLAVNENRIRSCKSHLMNTDLIETWRSSGLPHDALPSATCNRFKHPKKIYHLLLSPRLPQLGVPSAEAYSANAESSQCQLEPSTKNLESIFCRDVTEIQSIKRIQHPHTSRVRCSSQSRPACDCPLTGRIGIRINQYVTALESKQVRPSV